jgi:hypothetical protein
MKDNLPLPILVAEFSGIRYLFWSLCFKYGGWSINFIVCLFVSYILIFESILEYIYAQLFGDVQLDRASLQLLLGSNFGFVVHLINGLVPLLSFFLFMYYKFRKFSNTPKQLFWCENHFRSLKEIGGHGGPIPKVYEGRDFEYHGDFFNYENLEIQGKKLKSQGRFYLQVINNGVLNELSLNRMIDLDKKYWYIPRDFSS